MISVIVPVYNAEKYLRKCIESIINQTYKDLEIILVDDGSTDGSSEICDEYAEKDNRITVIHQENAGVSAARNAGLNSFKGNYVTFIDSDDYIEHDMFELIAKAIEMNSVDIVFIREQSVNLAGEVTYINGDTPTGEIQFFDRKKAEEFIIEKQINGMCDKTYKRELVEDLRVFEGKKHGEDLLFNVQVLERVESVALVDKLLYSYVSNEDSITHIPFNEHTTDAFYFKDETAKIIDKSFPQYSDLAQRRSFVARLVVARMLYKEKLFKEQEDLNNQITDYLKENYKKVSGSISKKERTEYLLFRYFKPLYCLYIRIIDKVKERRGL